jgi:SAM-dependent methyltransferase
MRRGAVSLAGFEEKFGTDPDPWNTWSAHYEAVKRDALAHMIGPGRYGRALELAAGNGSNTLMVASKALRLTVTEGTSAGAHLVEKAVRGRARVRVVRHDLAERLPGHAFDLIVISEVLYYLAPGPFLTLAREVERTLMPGGRLVLLHHGENFADRARPADTVHADFIAAIGKVLSLQRDMRTRRWRAGAWGRTL